MNRKPLVLIVDDAATQARLLELIAERAGTERFLHYRLSCA